MTPTFIVTATGTDIGKTVFAAGLVAALDGYYWKPIQAGLDGETDSQIVQRLSGLPASRILPEAYKFRTPASPHYAAELDDVEIEPEQLSLPKVDKPLIIEGAGGLLVPLTRGLLQADLFALWKAPAILCASTALGTINHSLLSIEALKRRAIPILGIAFIGDANADNEKTICDMARVTRIGRLPPLNPLTSSDLKRAFKANFDMARILGLGSGTP